MGEIGVTTLTRRTVPTMVAAFLAGLLALVASPAAAVAPPDGQVFVNELHYDNAGTDAGEAIEVAGPAGTDLAGWSLVLYNGSAAPSMAPTPCPG